MKVTINTIIVDDKQSYAVDIENTIKEFSETSVIANYKTKVYFERGFYAKVKKNLEQSIEEKHSIDLMFCDYHLEQSAPNDNGIGLFKIFQYSGLKPFKILHSNTTQKLPPHFPEYKSGIIDDLVSVKTPDEVIKKLQLFEREILKVKLYGNPKFYNKYYKDEENYTPISNDKIEISRALGISIIDILCLETIDENHTLLYRDISNEKIEIREMPLQGRKYNQSAFAVAAKNLPFARLNQSQTVNLLWVSKINFENKFITFITPNSFILKKKILNISKEEKFVDTYKEHYQNISSQLNSYFFQDTE